MTIFKKVALSTLAVAALSAGAIGTASAQIVEVVPVAPAIVQAPVFIQPVCYNYFTRVYNPYTGWFYNVNHQHCY